MATDWWGNYVSGGDASIPKNLWPNVILAPGDSGGSGGYNNSLGALYPGSNAPDPPPGQKAKHLDFTASGAGLLNAGITEKNMYPRYEKLRGQKHEKAGGSRQLWDNLTRWTTTKGGEIFAKRYPEQARLFNIYHTTGVRPPELKSTTVAAALDWGIRDNTRGQVHKENFLASGFGRIFTTVAQIAASFIPVVGPFVSAGIGAIAGRYRTGGNLKSGIIGGIQGYGIGAGTQGLYAGAKGLYAGANAAGTGGNALGLSGNQLGTIGTSGAGGVSTYGGTNALGLSGDALGAIGTSGAGGVSTYASLGANALGLSGDALGAIGTSGGIGGAASPGFDIGGAVKGFGRALKTGANIYGAAADPVGGAQTAPGPSYGAARDPSLGLSAQTAPDPSGYGPSYGAAPDPGYGAQTAPDPGYGAQTAPDPGYGAQTASATGYGAARGPSYDPGYGAASDTGGGYGPSYGAARGPSAAPDTSGYSAAVDLSGFDLPRGARVARTAIGRIAGKSARITPNRVAKGLRAREQKRIAEENISWQTLLSQDNFRRQTGRLI